MPSRRAQRRQQVTKMRAEGATITSRQGLKIAPRENIRTGIRQQVKVNAPTLGPTFQDFDSAREKFAEGMSQEGIKASLRLGHGWPIATTAKGQRDENGIVHAPRLNDCLGIHLKRVS
jgi:hypothetical protein